MNFLKWLGIVVLVAGATLVILVVASTFNHLYRLNKEAKAYPPPGKLVEVDGGKIHVFGEGLGDRTLLFMAGHGTSNPTIDFKPLWNRLTDKYRIVVVERPGYGWSEVTSTARDLDTMLEETRRALELAGEEGPYVLIPHSMSGLEALYWAQKYPSEVQAVIGLDPTVPEFVEHSLEIPRKAELYFMYLISRMGVSRFMPEDEVKQNFPLMGSRELSKEDKERFMAMFYRSAYTINMLKEIDYLEENAEKVQQNPAPVETPMYFFISDGQEVTDADWREILSNYISNVNFGKYRYLDCGHYLHHEKPGLIAGEIEAFLGGLKD